ncbi:MULTISPECIES: M23 family metallopeptidase [unclassified Imperialibacter]|uniref:M23 family metallopeptidase n=1 Tax=unclassified Imperialibacter TaxID=2629706 RepID=UPI001255C310|nr:MULTISPECIES: M23 family metallopeptidase [unclassified Imperialibacter]CAD5271199.1 Peptidase M23-like protein [Imperialibacter sp. 89]CAD5298675.1 Peptidase M23-like protein [Imperialibacter sp. 75]VVT35004.1 Peptidase m23 [Imperialibacter sp. EC-SDR9]
MKNKKTLSSWLTTGYLLIIRSEENFAEKSTIRFNYARLLLLAFVVVSVFFAICFYLATTILAKWYDPRHQQMETNRKLVSLSLKVDSMLVEMDNKDLYIDNLKLVLSGDTSMLETESDLRASEQQERVLSASEINSERLAPIDSIFRQRFESADSEILPVSSSIGSDLQDIYLFQPISGIISDKFNPKNNHYGTDVVAKKDEPVKCVADGTVILADWTQNDGYVIGIQHRSNLISVYKHNSELLKNVGSFVSAGEIISIIGNTGELTTGPHLHFELWHNGMPVDPEEFVAF